MRTWSRLIKIHFVIACSAFVISCGETVNPSGGGIGGGENTPPVDETASGTVTISYTTASSAQIGLSGQGGINSAVLTFNVTNENGIGLAGERVNFELDSSIGGATLISDVTAVSTNVDGNVFVTVESGNISTTVSIIATIDGTETFAISEGINISTGVPVASKFDLAASPQWNTERTLTHNGIEVEISVYAGDSFGNTAFDGVGISFWSPEMGTIEPSCILENGSCTVVWTSSGIRPIDHQVTILAYTSGAEDFEDLNGNNLFDAGETWTDLPEIYADEDDDDNYSIGEYFVDSNGNGVWDAVGNGVWDGPCPTGSTGCTEDSTVTIAPPTAGVLILCPEKDLVADFPLSYHGACESE